MCMYVCMYVCMCVCACVRACVCVCVCACVCVYRPLPPMKIFLVLFSCILQAKSHYKRGEHQEGSTMIRASNICNVVGIVISVIVLLRLILIR